MKHERGWAWPESVVKSVYWGRVLLLPQPDPLTAHLGTGSRALHWTSFTTVESKWLLMLTSWR